MDLEMTGLDPKKHVIVEIATLVTDSELNIIEEGPDLVLCATESQLAGMDEFVTAMHRRSGLLEEIGHSSITIDDAVSQTIDFLKKHIPLPGTAPLCGNSIGTDRRFLIEYMPAVEEYLHYRSVDVSTVKELARRWYPEVMAGAPDKAGGHRAMDDIRESVAELAYYRAAVFKDAASGSPPPT